jgi:protein phosphatase
MDQPMTNGNANPSPPVELAALTDVGRRRGDNQDAYALLAELGGALVADGMGGHARGDLASALAISAAARELLDSAPRHGHQPAPASMRLTAAVASANRTILSSASKMPGTGGMGTTLLAVLFEAGRLHVAHVGDSRLYRLRDTTLERLTTDQTVGELLAGRRGQGGSSPFANVLTQALGCETDVAPEQYELECSSGDLYLLCSDGLHGMLDDEGIRLTLLNFGANLGQAARELVRLANERGGLDNITVVLARPITPTDADHGDRAG